jgi:hypothetical protein
MYGLTTETFLLILLVSLIIWFWITWLIITSAVKSGIKNLTSLLRKDLELKGVSKEELNDLCEIETKSQQIASVKVPFKLDKDGKMIG